MAKTCAICGKPSGMYPLCATCFKLRDAGEVEKCEDCGEWYRVSEGCKCKPKKAVSASTSIPAQKKTIPVTDELTCLICGEPSNGKHFCLNCYHKYKDHAVDIRIENCRTTQIIDLYGNQIWVCKDGRKTRSMSERQILDYFYDHRIRVVYEKPVYYMKDNGDEAELRIDFYLEDYDLYIEFNGLTSDEYLRSKAFTKKIMDKKGLTLVVLEPTDLININKTFERLLERYKKK